MECLVCSGSVFNGLYDELLRKCTRCGFVTANYDMSSYDADEIYDEDYFMGSEYEHYVRDKDAFIRNFNARIDRLQKLDPGRRFENILELGCAYGFFGLVVKQRFPNSQYTGLDITPKPIDHGKNEYNLNLICKDYLTFQRGGQTYTDVFMWDVIEHLPSPDAVIEKVYADLDEGGRLYITTGDISALLPRLQGKRWRMIHPPSHLHYFSRKTISVLLERKGFRIVAVLYPAVRRSLKQIYHSLFILNKSERTFHKKIHSLIPEALQIPLNTFDIMMVVAEKRAE